MSMPFIDLHTQQSFIRSAIEDRWQDILNHGAYIMGPEVMQMERELAEFCDRTNSTNRNNSTNSTYCVSCASGTDALLMSLMAWDIGVGDAVFVPAFTFTASCEVISVLGATPVFVDVQSESFNICPISLRQGIRDAKKAGLNLKCVIAVDLFGRSVDWDTIIPIARADNMYVLDDAAQAFGGSYNGRMIGTIGDVTATSFFPAKPLGCYGDGGAIFTGDADMQQKLLSIRVHGQDMGDKYKNARLGINGRMDTIQAAVILEKMTLFKQEITLRNQVARRYNQMLSGTVGVPVMTDGIVSTWAQYTVILPDGSDRNAIQSHMRDKGVPTAVYYPIPMHRQQAYQNGITAGEDLPNSDYLSQRVLSLPMHPYLSEDDQHKVVDALKSALRL